MSHTQWHRHEDEILAIDELLDAAGRAFAEFGVANATMIDIARAAGCARATLYRYFPNQSTLHVAYVHRATRRITEQLATQRAGSPGSLADRILAGIAAVRADPLLAVWFEPENMAVPMQIARDADLMRLMTAGFAEQAKHQSLNQDELELRGEWMLRSILSLLANPGRDSTSERAMIESFVVPVITSSPHEKRLPT